jgi:hypothetical protein
MNYVLRFKKSKIKFKKKKRKKKSKIKADNNSDYQIMHSD